MRCLLKIVVFSILIFKRENISDLPEYGDYSNDYSLDGIVDQFIMYYIKFIIYTKLLP